MEDVVPAIKRLTNKLKTQTYKFQRNAELSAFRDPSDTDLCSGYLNKEKQSRRALELRAIS